MARLITALLAAMAAVALLAASAEARRAPTESEKQAMLGALRAERPDLPASCYARYRVSTIKSAYAMVSSTPVVRCGGSWDVLLRRSGPTWRVAGSGSEWFCDDPNRAAPASVVRELLAPARCLATQQSNEFVTPSNNIARAYDPSVRGIACYVRSTRTLVRFSDTGASIPIITRNAGEPTRLKKLAGPVLPYGSTWRSPHWIRCASLAAALRCDGARGAGFSASGTVVRLN